MHEINAEEPITERKNTTQPNAKGGTEQWHKMLIQVSYDFAENTTLNGIKYMAEKGTSVLERIFWTSTFVLSTVLCILMVYKSYVKYDTSGVVVTLKEHLVSANEYPFPAITICPQARIRQSKFNYTSIGMNAYRYGLDDDDEFRKFHSTMVLCNNDEKLNSSDSYIFLNYTIDISTFFQVAPSHDDIFAECSWRNKVDCMKRFRPVLTADGVCFTFNILATDQIFRKGSVHQKRYYLNTSTPMKNWSLRDNYNSSANDTFPRRGRANGAREDLYISLKEVSDRDFSCDEQTRPGYKVYLHHPGDLPQASLHSYAAQPGKTTSLAIKLDILDTAAELASYDSDIRQCYFPDEKYLQFFERYTSLNCQLECLTNYTVQRCKCASFYMPRNISTPICKANQWHCVEAALDQYAAEEDLNDSGVSRCKCLPSCKDVNYDAEVVLTKLDLKEYNKRSKEQQKLLEDFFNDDDYDDDDEEETYESETNSTNTMTKEQKDDVSDDEATLDDSSDDDVPAEEQFTEIRIYYRRPRFVAMERSELVGLSQFLADVGGTLGLFLGFSFLTLAEIFYFFTVKLACQYQRESSARNLKSKNNDPDKVVNES